MNSWVPSINYLRLRNTVSGPEIVDSWGLNGPLLPQSPLEKVGGFAPLLFLASAQLGKLHYAPPTVSPSRVEGGMGVGGGVCIKRVSQGTFYFVLVSPPGGRGRVRTINSRRRSGVWGRSGSGGELIFVFVLASAQLGKLYHALASYFVSLSGFIFLCIAFALWFAA